MAKYLRTSNDLVAVFCFSGIINSSKFCRMNIYAIFYLKNIQFFWKTGNIQIVDQSLSNGLLYQPAHAQEKRLRFKKSKPLIISGS
jgi:hypothetical protein